MLRKAPIVVDGDSEDADVEPTLDDAASRLSQGHSGTESEADSTFVQSGLERGPGGISRQHLKGRARSGSISKSPNSHPPPSALDILSSAAINHSKSTSLPPPANTDPSTLPNSRQSSTATLIGGLKEAFPKSSGRTSTSADTSRREKQLKSRVNQLQGKIQQLEHMAGKYKKVLKEISTLERLPPSDISTSQAMHILLRYCRDNRLRHTAEALQKESIVATRLYNHMKLRRYLERRDFAKAVGFVQHVMTDIFLNAAARQKLATSFEDLMYVLNKYFFICQVEKNQHDAARHILDTVIRPHVERERAKQGRRGEWFVTDHKLLTELLTHSPTPENIYTSFNWTHEIGLFWSSARRAHESVTDPHAAKKGEDRVPLYAHVVAEWFLSEEVDDEMNLGMLVGCKKWRDGVLGCLVGEGFSFGGGKVVVGEGEDGEREGEEGEEGDEEEEREETGSVPPAAESAFECGQSQVDKIPEAEATSLAASATTRGAPALSVARPPAAPPPGSAQLSQRTPVPVERTLRHVASTPVIRAVSVVSNQSGTSVGSAGTARLRRSKRDSFSGGVRPAKSELDDVERSPAFPTLVETDKLPPLPLEPEAADFALSTVSGPVLGQVRALDVRDIPDTGQIIAATAGGDDRTDKRISIFDVRSGTLLTQLDNGTSKAILQLAFHPTRPELLLSADMEFDVKLWDWRKGVLVRVWRKHHTRIVNRVCWVAGSEVRAASCSTDQSVKIWDTTLDKPAISSVHANEPFTSFVFCGEEEERQKLVASLSFALRVYKVRTMTLITTIQLTELRTNKTPITALTVHPVYDNYVLVSSDNQLRLIDIVTETTLKTFSAREISDGTRIEGQFSPGGTFVFSGTSDTRAFLTRGRRAGLGGEDDGGDGEDEGGSSGVGGGVGKATGVYVWRVHTGRLERSEMRALEESAGGSGWGRVGVGVCKWIIAHDASRPPNETRRKVLVAAGLDRTIRMYM
ncbi:hypothetical protein HDV00_002027 [Rhizophlyctis rosea]|nr:hypothetical protein HDV00_002027 [Rhizophlyctis rosea]